MIKKVFAVYDKTAELYSTPFFMNTVGEGLRAFRHLVQDPQSFVSRMPGDFKLVELGAFDDVLGTIVSCDARTLAHGSEFERLPASVQPIGIVRKE